MTLALCLAGAGPAVASGWAFQAVPAVPGPTGTSGQLSAVSCTSRTSCVAVGSYTNSGVALPLAERWNGARWSIQQTPIPAGANGASLLGVSCTSKNACIAVGSYTIRPGDVQATLAERWNGARWAIQRTPSPAALPELDGVSCTSRTACIAVGSYVNTAYTAAALVERWNGSRWSMQRVPNPAGAVSTALFGVSCTSRTACTAVGNLHTSLEPVLQLTLAERWNGTRWRVQRTPNPAGGPSPSLSGVSCISRTACTAVGNAALAERWNGSRWRIRRAARPAGATNISLTGVSCASSSDCIAVGSYTNRAGAQVALAESFNGARWKIQRTPTRPAGATSTALSGVSCTSRTACTTDGSFTSSTKVQLTLGQRWNGTRWVIQRTRNPVFRTGSSALNGVSCPSATTCTAVGSYTNSAGSQAALAERWDGTSWTFQTTPSPSGASSSALNGVSCASPTACIAVGSYTTSPGDVQALAEAWDGTSWTIQSTATPTGATGASLSGISCTSPSACFAVGNSEAPGNELMTLAEGWDGSSWTIQSTSNPTTYTQLNSVSCTSAVACTAVGSYSTTTSRLVAAEIWDGSSWTIQDTPNLAPQDRGTWLDAVSCSSGTACTAVGGWSAYHVSGFVADFWDGTTWTIQSTPSSTFPGGELNGVSCTSATACTAVGELSSAVGLPAPVADTWDGTSWTLQNTPTPGYTHFNAVSCTSATVCTAVGSYFIERES